MSKSRDNSTAQGSVLTANGQIHDSAPRRKNVLRYVKKSTLAVIAVIATAGVAAGGLSKVIVLIGALYQDGEGASGSSIAGGAEKPDDSGSQAPKVLEVKPWWHTTDIVHVSQGAFRMGSPADETGRDSDERPHDVELTTSFWITTTEITQGQWSELMLSSPSYFKECGPECPVERVNWFEAVTFANLLSEKHGLNPCYELTACKGILGEGCAASKPSCEEGYLCEYNHSSFRGHSCNGYRLPTEAEWEYAARAGMQSAIYIGSLGLPGTCEAPQLEGIAWYCGNSAVEYSTGEPCSSWPATQYKMDRCGTHPVALKLPNALGLYDMIGNVWEWAQDGVEWDGQILDNTYEGSQENPLSLSGSHRVLRGCGWDDGGGAKNCRAAARHADEPNHRHNNLGFRLVKTGEYYELAD